MARAKGFQGIVGREKGTTWGTATAAGANDGVEAISLVESGGTALIEDNQLTGRITQRASDAGLRNITVTLRSALRYEGNGKEVAYLMGTAGVPSTVDTTARLHTYKIKDDLDGIFNTLAYELVKDVAVVELSSVKWTKLKISGKAGERVEIEVQGIAYDWVQNAGGGTNNTTTIDTITLPANREFVLFSQGVLLMNAQGGGSLAGGDAVYISEFELNVERGMDARFSTGGGNKCDEPLPNGWMKVSGSFTFAALQDGTGGNLAFLAEQLAATPKKATLTFTSPNNAGAATEKYSWKFWLPYLQFGEAKVGLPGPGGQTWTQPFEAKHVPAIPTGFTAGYVDAVTINNTNQDTADSLA